MQSRLLQIVVIGMMLLSGCGGAKSGPEPLPLDRVNCAKCGMLISSLANAGQAVSREAETRFYDDIGCMAADTAMTGDANLFVQLADGTGWTPVTSAWFAASPQMSTPMGYGFTAHASEEAARKADAQPRAQSWAEIVRRGERR